MADQNAQDRNLPASAKKLKKARDDGQVARSRDLGHFTAMGAGGALLVVLAPMLVDWLKQMLAQALRFNLTALSSPAQMGEVLSDLTFKLVLVVAPMGIVMALVALASAVAAGGMVWTLQPVTPKFERVSPLAGIGRLFSWQHASDALKSSLLALILGAIGTLVLKDRMANYVGMMAVPLPNAIGYAGELLSAGLLLLVIALALFAAIDVPLQRALHLRRLKMTREEAKQEYKEAEGNAEVKGRMRQRMREMAKHRMLAAVPKADLVVMNPTHYAVALKYDETAMGAPRVVAKGADLMAMKIRDLAKESKVPVLQSPMLARALYAHSEVDKEIPAALFAAVAQVLAYVYQLRAAMAGRAPMPEQQPQPDVPVELDPHHKAAKAAAESAKADPETDA
nr:flagellar biosynthesis protein FlhB [uncultured Roseateles sp.]